MQWPGRLQLLFVILTTLGVFFYMIGKIDINDHDPLALKRTNAPTIEGVNVVAVNQSYSNGKIAFEANKSDSKYGGQVAKHNTTDTEVRIAENCQVSSLDESLNNSPLLVLNPKQIIYPALLWGPNNQLEGLREAMMVAIKLNRTLVVPHFFPQHNAQSGPRLQFVSALNRIDVDKLSNLLSTITIPEMQRICNKKFDVVFQNRPRWCMAIKQVQVDTEMDIFNISSSPDVKGKIVLSGKLDQKCWQPEIPAFPESINDRTKHDINRLPEIFNSSAPCALLLFPFLSLSKSLMSAEHFSTKYYHEEEVFNLIRTETVRNASFELLSAAIMHATQRPSYVRKITKHFITKVMKGELFIAVHWRFDDEMMRSLCNRKSPVCNHKPTSDDVTQAIWSVQLKVAESLKSDKVIPVYIAAPPTSVDFVTEVKSKLNEMHVRAASEDNNTRSSINSQPCTFRLENLQDFLQRHYPAQICPDIRPTKNELWSILEMEISSRSHAFLFSHGSTWSQTILQSRSSSQKLLDRSLIDVISKTKKLLT